MDKDKLIADLQAKVAELEKDLHMIQRHYDQLDTNAEPVAWQRDDGVIAFFEKPKVDKQGFKWRALYTTPKTKQCKDCGEINPAEIHTCSPQTNAEPDCYGDGNVYRGVRSKDSEVKTYVFDEHAGKTTWVSTPQTKPLTDEEINDLLIPITSINIWDEPNELVKLARAVEAKIRGE